MYRRKTAKAQEIRDYRANRRKKSRRGRMKKIGGNPNLRREAALKPLRREMENGNWIEGLNYRV